MTRKPKPTDDVTVRVRVEKPDYWVAVVQIHNDQGEVVGENHYERMPTGRKEKRDDQGNLIEFETRGFQSKAEAKAFAQERLPDVVKSVTACDPKKELCIAHRDKPTGVAFARKNDRWTYIVEVVDRNGNPVGPRGGYAEVVPLDYKGCPIGLVKTDSDGNPVFPLGRKPLRVADDKKTREAAQAAGDRLKGVRFAEYRAWKDRQDTLSPITKSTRLTEAFREIIKEVTRVAEGKVLRDVLKARPSKRATVECTEIRRKHLDKLRGKRSAECAARNPALVDAWERECRRRDCRSKTQACERVAAAAGVKWRTVQRAVEAAGKWPKKH